MRICREKMEETRQSENNWSTSPLCQHMRRRWYDVTGSVIRRMMPESPSRSEEYESAKKCWQVVYYPGPAVPLANQYTAQCHLSTEQRVARYLRHYRPFVKNNDYVHFDETWYRNCTWNIIWNMSCKERFMLRDKWTIEVVAVTKHCGCMYMRYQIQSRRWIELHCLQRINSY